LLSQILKETFRKGNLSAMSSFIHDRDLGDVERRHILSVVFWRALRRRRWDIAKCCILQGYEITPRPAAAWGPIHGCLSHLGNRSDVVEWLLNEGAEVDRRGPSNITPLIAAIQLGFADIADVLVRAGADVNASTITDEDLTPLMAAARQGDNEIVRLLLSRGADPVRPDHLGQTAAEYAKAAGHDDIAAMIQLHMPGTTT
jgi:hypothetical protein